MKFLKRCEFELFKVKYLVVEWDSFIEYLLKYNCLEGK